MKQLRKDFRQFLETGAYCTPPGRAACALANARILRDWREAEDAGLVRIIAEPEQDSYFHVYGEPDSEKERAAIVRSLDLWGCYCVIAQYRADPDDEWEDADSIGMCVYEDPTDPFQNCYVPDLMLSALRALPLETIP